MSDNQLPTTNCQLPTVNYQLDLARRYVEQTGVSLFLTGKAGTGKTTFLRNIDTECKKHHIVVAPTGVAAVNAGGVTIHSFFQLPFDPYLPDIKELITEYQMPEARKGLNKTKMGIIRSLELLIIDEISMVRADLLDAIDATLRRYRRNSRPFGGVQLLMIGDVHQLAPVVTERERPFMERVYPSPYFFNSKALQRLNYITIELTTIYRQQDQTFVNLLNRVRNNQMDASTLATLNSRYIRGGSQTGTPRLPDPITLTTHNHQADAINRRHMEALHGESRVFEATVSGNYPDSTMPVERSMEIKIGERVMLVKNDTSGAQRYYNGKLATVTGFIDNDDGSYIEVIDDDGDIIAVGRERWENLRYNINESNGEITQEVDGTFSQYPLRAAWAVTIHKAQGLTFDRVAVDAADAFAFGQVYVALSRCRSLEGLTLTSPLTAAVTFGDPSVERFISSCPTFDQVRQAEAGFEQQYYYEQLTDLFSLASVHHEAESLDEVYTRLKNLYPENVEVMHGIASDTAGLATVSEKFALQLMRLPADQHHERLEKACLYYLPRLALCAARLEGVLNVEIDNKENRKAVAEGGERLATLLRIKIAALHAVQREGFSIPVVQKAKWQAENGKVKIEKSRRREKAARRREPAATAEPAPPEVVPSTPKEKAPSKAETRKAQTADLMERIRVWRWQKSKDTGLPPYIILQQKSLIAIATAMPHTLDELKRLPGIGPKTIENYGPEILEIVGMG